MEVEGRLRPPPPCILFRLWLSLCLLPAPIALPVPTFRALCCRHDEGSAGASCIHRCYRPAYAALLQQRQLSLRGGTSQTFFADSGSMYSGSYDSDSFNEMISIPSSDEAVETGTDFASESVVV